MNEHMRLAKHENAFCRCNSNGTVAMQMCATVTNIIVAIEMRVTVAQDVDGQSPAVDTRAGGGATCGRARIKLRRSQLGGLTSPLDWVEQAAAKGCKDAAEWLKVHSDVNRPLLQPLT